MKTKGHRESSQDVVNMMNLRKSSRIAKLSLSASPNIKELVPKTSDFIEPELAKPGPTGFPNLPSSKVKRNIYGHQNIDVRVQVLERAHQEMTLLKFWKN